MSLHVECFEPQRTPRAVLIWCHGLASEPQRAPDDPGYTPLGSDAARRGYASIVFDFRGAYRSSGDFSLGGWVNDLDEIAGLAAKRWDVPTVVAGSSLGGAVALLEAADDPRVAAVATLAAPSDFEDLEGPQEELFIAQVDTARMFRTPGYPEDMNAWRGEFRTLVPAQAAARLARPLLVLHGLDDQTVPVRHARKLRDAAGDQVTLAELAGAGHRLRHDRRAIEILYGWLEATLCP